VIPVRMDATRLPGKPLLRLDGRTIVQWVYDAAVESAVFAEVVVATPDDDIADAVRAFGGAVAMTGRHHATGTDRVAEVARTRPDFDIVANVQGDQPFVTTAMLQPLIDSFVSAPDQDMATLGAPLDFERGLHDPNTVKVVADQRSFALYFSRSPLPFWRDGTRGVGSLGARHIGLYAWRRATLLALAAAPRGRLERAEELEQLRALERGVRIKMISVDSAGPEVDTPDDLERVRHLVEGAA